MTDSSKKINELELQLMHFKVAFDNIDACIYIKDCNGIYTYVNKQVCDLLQTSALDLIGYTDEDLFDLTKSEELKYHDKMVLENGRKIETTETNYLTNIGESKTFWSLKTPLYDKKGKIIGLCGISKDVSNKREVKSKSGPNNQICKGILDNSSTSLFVKDRMLKCNYVNYNSPQTGSIDLNKKIHNNVKKPRAGDIIDKFIKIDMEVLPTDKKNKERISSIDTSRNYRGYPVGKVLMSNEDKFNCMLNKVYDISEITEIQKKILNQNKELKLSLQHRAFFLNMVVHDLRAPLGFIKLISETLKKNARKKDLALLNFIHATSTDMIELVNNLLEISLIDSRVLNLRKTQIDYVLFIKDIVRKNQFSAREKNIKIKTHIKFRTKFITIDVLKIEQVLNNLISNALKFSEFNSVITINSFEENNTIFTQIIDEGQGIRPEDLDNIFLCFKGSNSITSNAEKSYGLGLRIAKKLINAHNGQISVKSVFKKGTVFTFSLPIYC